MEAESSDELSSSPFTGDALELWKPREVKGDDLRSVMAKGDFNMFTNEPLSMRYKNILETRKTLPVYAKMDEFLEIFQNNQIMIIVGETGSGKTTQIPQFVSYSDLPHISGKIIACTQPRRVAAMSVARRVADELDVQLGKQVGYSIRFDDSTTPGTTFLKYMTDGMLLREAMNDPILERYSTIILDEAHERTHATDILLGLLKGIVKKRPDLKVIIMSATLDALKFQKYFSIDPNVPPPLFSVPGRTHPVEVFYTTDPVDNYIEAAMHTVFMIHEDEGPGDILVFLTGEDEIDDVCRKIRHAVNSLIKENPKSIGPLMCIPLYSSLPPSQQQRIFDPAPTPRVPGGPPGRKVVVATNIAETSLTIDGIVYVVDPGFAKQKIYDPRSRVESLLVSPISKASAKQRAGRAGRTKPGKCFRLYREKDFLDWLKSQTPPEILRSNLNNPVLELMKLGITDLVSFDYVDAPAAETLMRALELLHFLGALDVGKLTPLGREMAEFPLDPQLTKTLIASAKYKCSDEVLTIAAMLASPKIWMRPSNKRRDADRSNASLTIPDGDHLTLLNVYNEYIKRSTDVGLEQWAWSKFLSLRALQQAENIRSQLERMMEKFDIEIVSEHQSKNSLHTNIRKSFVAGYFMQVGYCGQSGHYVTKDNQVVSLHPSCGLDNRPDWVVFNEFVHTRESYIRTVSMTKLEWLIDVAPTYFDPSTFPEGEMRSSIERYLEAKEAQATTTCGGMETARMAVNEAGPSLGQC